MKSHKRVTRKSNISYHKFNFDEENFLIKNCVGISGQDLIYKFNYKFGIMLTITQLKNFKSSRKLKSGIIGGRFKKGIIPTNKGKKWADYMTTESQINSLKTTIKKGNIPHNHRLVGSTRITKDGLLEIKTKEPNKWELKHRFLYEQNNGRIPKGFNVIFADRNKNNFDIDNLILVSNSELLQLNKNGLIRNTKEITKSGVLVAKVLTAISKRRKSSKKDKEQKMNKAITNY